MSVRTSPSWSVPTMKNSDAYLRYTTLYSRYSINEHCTEVDRSAQWRGMWDVCVYVCVCVCVYVCVWGFGRVRCETHRTRKVRRQYRLPHILHCAKGFADPFPELHTAE